MTMLLIFVDADHAGDVAALLDRHAVDGFSQFPTVLGKGSTGTKLGTRAFPGSSTLFMAALSSTVATTVTADLAMLRATHGPEEGLKVYALDAMEVL